MIGKQRLDKYLPAWLFSAEHQKIVRIAIIVGVLLVSILITLPSDERVGLGLVGLLVAAAGVVILLRRKALGLVILIIAAMLIPTPEVSGAGGYLVPPILLVALMLGLWAFDMLARYRRIKFVRSRTLLPAIALGITSIIAFLNGRILYNNFAHLAPLQAQIGGLAVFIISIGIFLLAANLIEDELWLRRIVWVFIALGGVYILGRITPFTESLIRPLYQYGADSSLFWIWLVAMTGSQAFFNPHLSRRLRGVLFGVLAATLYLSLVQTYDWKSGWLPALVALFVVIWLGVPRFRIFGILIAILFAAFYVLGKTSQWITGGEDYSILTRFAAWQIVFEIIKVNPILGLGMSNYYWYTPLYSILSYRGLQFSSHNNYIDILAQTGLIGLGFFLWLIYEIGRLGWELLHHVPVGFPKAYVIVVLGGLAGTLASGMLGDWFLPFVYNVGLHGMRSSLIGWLFMGGLVALEEIYRNRVASG